MPGSRVRVPPLLLAKSSDPMGLGDFVASGDSKRLTTGTVLGPDPVRAVARQDCASAGSSTSLSAVRSSPSSFLLAVVKLSGKIRSRRVNQLLDERGIRHRVVINLRSLNGGEEGSPFVRAHGDPRKASP